MSVARMPRLAIQIDTVLPKTAGVKKPSPPTIRAKFSQLPLKPESAMTSRIGEPMGTVTVMG